MIAIGVDFVRKALSTPATMSKEFIVKFRLVDKVECCFDIVAVFLPTMLPVLATMSNEISSFRQSLNN